MFMIRDAEGNERARMFSPFRSLEEAIERGPDNVDMDRERYPQEFPFSVIDERTGDIVHQWTL
jgi:hypothetical protein